eukprot:CAMPEP_0172392802 /NCGR_PEP_ID=MMETSP1061-20121228/8823_1 /TAXON_ID=37318 /ORGANISM="Pseudo-nitzschia pungens, Strain cf. pungens" /LENGTH=296 /DNA_ID=CAMNT_0013123707 /DNA_START=510 /DNA_END=1400 /DNA_ORIENTATION=-
MSSSPEQLQEHGSSASTSTKRKSSVVVSVQKVGLDLGTLPPEIASVLSPLDLNGNQFIEQDEIIQAGRALQAERKTNSRLRWTVGFMFLGYLVLVSTIVGLVNWVVILHKDTQVLSGSGTLVVASDSSSSSSSSSKNNSNEESIPVSTSTNEAVLSMGLIPFLPRDVCNKISSVAFGGEDESENGNDRLVRYRTVASMDVLPEKGFTITTTTGDVLEWDNASDAMTVTFGDGTSYTTSVLCQECSAVNVVATDERIRAASESLQDLFGIDDNGSSNDAGQEGVDRRRLMAFDQCSF